MNPATSGVRNGNIDSLSLHRQSVTLEQRYGIHNAMVPWAMEIDIARKYNIWEDVIRIINIRASKHRREIKISMINPWSPIYEEDSSRGITMRSSRQDWTFEKLNTNQPDAFIDSPFYLLSSIYIRDILAYTSRFRSTTRIIRFDKDYRYVRKVIDYVYDACSVTIHVTTNHENRARMFCQHVCLTGLNQ